MPASSGIVSSSISRWNTGTPDSIRTASAVVGIKHRGAGRAAARLKHDLALRALDKHIETGFAGVGHPRDNHRMARRPIVRRLPCSASADNTSTDAVVENACDDRRGVRADDGELRERIRDIAERDVFGKNKLIEAASGPSL